MTTRHSRRHFVKLVGGAALALRHGLLPAQTPRGKGPAIASLCDSAICIEWDANLHTRVSREAGTRRLPLTAWSASDYLLRADGHHIADFEHIGTDVRKAIDDEHGRGSRLILRGKAVGLEKTLTVSLYESYPGFAIVQADYRNIGATPVWLQGWSAGDFLVKPGTANNRPAAARAAGTAGESAMRGPGFWSYSGATYEDRRDWVQPLHQGFTQDNFLGMEASDYGGGTPIVDVWHRDAGLAVGHVEAVPSLVSLPLQEQGGHARIALSARAKHELMPGDSYQTLNTFVTVHTGDHFATLDTYRRFMAQRGLKAAAAGAASYEPIWCAWGYERSCTTELIEGTLPKVKELGLKWAVIDDGWQSNIGDWHPHPQKYPNGEADLRRLVAAIRAADLKPRLWYSPLSVAPGSDLLHDHADMLLLDKDGAPQLISWWNSFYLCPAYYETIRYTQALVQQFIGGWGFSGLKIDGQHLNGVAPCFNPAHGHARPEESVERLKDFYRAIYDTAIEADPGAVVEVCPCGTAYSVFNFPYMNQVPASDPESSWQVRLKGKSLKALMGPQAPFAGDHVELSDRHDDFASTVGVGGVVSTKFTWPMDPKPKDSFLLTPQNEPWWRRWIALYNEHQLPLGTYRGELYDIGFDVPETHAIEKSGRLYYAFFAERWSGAIALRGLQNETYRIRDYFNERDLGTVFGARAQLTVKFERFLLLEARPA